MNILTEHILIAGISLFALGLLGFLTRRSLILVFISLELMLAAVSVNFVAYSRSHGNYQGQVMAIFVLTIAACEASLALALIVALYRRIRSLDFQAWNTLGETKDEYAPSASSEIEFFGAQIELPVLTPAGLDPLAHPVSRTATVPADPTHSSKITSGGDRA
jgi:NADH-quinone oxidoreductase subunit K